MLFITYKCVCMYKVCYLQHTNVRTHTYVHVCTCIHVVCVYIHSYVVVLFPASSKSSSVGSQKTPTIVKKGMYAMCIYIHVHVRTYIRIYMYVYCIYVHVYTLCPKIIVFQNVELCTCKYIHVHVHVYTHTCTYVRNYYKSLHVAHPPLNVHVPIIIATL